MIDIITVHQDISFLLYKFLRELRRNTDEQYRLIVVDNNSKNKTKDFLKNERDNKKIVLIEINPDNYALHVNNERIEKLAPEGGRWIGDGSKILTHGQCLDAAIDKVQSDYFVVMDIDVFVKRGWLKKMLNESKANDAACVGQSKLGPYNTSRIWVANCLYDTEKFMSDRVSMQPLKYGNKIYDTADYQSSLLWMKYANVHIPDFERYWEHISSLYWLYNCLKTEPEYNGYKIFENGEFVANLNTRPLHVILKASWWFQKLYTESLPNDIDIPWFPEDHMILIEKIKNKGIKISDQCNKYLKVSE